MAGVIHDITQKLSTTKAAPNHPVGDSVAPPTQQGSEEQTFNILPHPAKSNDPADLQKPGGDLRSGQGGVEAFKAAPGPVILNQETLNNLGPAKTREELEVLQAELNRKS